MRTLLTVLTLLDLLCVLNGPGARAQATADPGIFLNINCGSSKDIQDPTAIGLKWYADTGYTSGGLTSTNVPTWEGYPQLNSLRYFPDAEIPKYCYQLPVIALSTYMVRTEFYYGNYDNRRSPPTFYLSIDGVIVANITNTQDTAYYFEQTFQAQGNATFICLMRDDSNDDPFISTISLRRIKPYPTMATNHLEKGYIAVTRNRRSFGATDIRRYPDDIYDRYWEMVNETEPAILYGTEPMTPLYTTASLLYANGNPDYQSVPVEVLQSALAMTAPGTMTLTFGRRIGVTGFLFLHFAELDSAVDITSRIFTATPSTSLNSVVTVNIRNQSLPGNGTGWFWDPLALQDPSVSSKMTVTLQSTPDSVYGPSINACEFFEIIPQVAPAKTVSDDGLAIEHIKESLKLEQWTGDPCIPVPHTWVNCSSTVDSPAPTIESVNLDNFNLTGTIPVEFNELPKLTTLVLSDNNFDGILTDLSLLKNLRVLHLQNNNLSGPLPDWLGHLPLLRELNVQNNSFSGDIPTGLIHKNGLNFTYQPGNPGLSASTVIKKKNIWIIVGPILGAVFALAVGIFFVFCCCVCKKRGLKENLPVTTSGAEEAPTVEMGTPVAGGAKSFSVASIAVATQHFNREIGRGGFGPVYYGELPGGQQVAVKVLHSTTSHQGLSEFFNEVDVLSKVHHRNLVQLLGFCNEGESRMLVYEYLPQGSLRGKLDASAEGILDFKARINIALNAAQGLEYLHTGCNPSIVHRDVKSTNILVTDTKDCAKVSDFGLSRPEAGGNGSITFVKGTRGYIDPEYVHSQRLTTKSDVFSFGVVLLELLTGRLPAQPSQGPQPQHAWTLCDWVRTTLQSENDAAVQEILDPAVKASRPNMEALWKVADCAMMCVEPKSIHRPTMSQVVQELRAALALEEANSMTDMPQPNFDKHPHPPSSDGYSSGVFAADLSWPAPR